MTIQQVIARELAFDRPGHDTEADLRHASNITDALEREGFVIVRKSTWDVAHADLARANAALREHGINPMAGLA